MKKILTFAAIIAASLSVVACGNNSGKQIDSLSYAIGADLGLNLSLGMKDFDLDREIVIANIKDFYKNGDVEGEEIKEVRNQMMQYQYTVLMPFMYAKRSQDMLAANAWNVAQYAALVMMFAQVSGLKAGTLMHVIADAHIYDRHIPIVEELIKRTPFDAPKVTLDPNVSNFYDFTPDSFTVENYQHGEKVGKFPVAV